MTDHIVTHKFIPGAPPPPITPTKSQKKKRSKTKQKSADPTATSSLPTSPLQPHDDLPDSKLQDLQVQDEEPKTTPMLDVLNKRLKATTKKIVSVHLQPFPFPSSSLL
jgi:hypothetical protein